MDYYQRLRVSRDATRAQIRVAYLRLVALHHPDHNFAADAATLTAELNEAWSFLEDEQKRRAYDESLRAAAFRQASPRQHDEAPPPRRPHVPRIKCEKCGVIDSSLRSAAFLRSVSFIKSFSRTVDAGVLCQRCRTRAAVKANLITGVMGWWSPSGLFSAPHALWVNTRGGSQDGPRNAALLRTLGHQLFARGDLAESARALRASLALAVDERTSQLLDSVSAHVRSAVASPRRRSVAPFLAAVIAPVFFSACGVWVALQPAAQATSNAPDLTPSSPPAVTTRPVAAHEEEISTAAPSDPYVARLASIVEVRSPIVGTHAEGQAIVREHALDRARFDASEIDQIADALQQQIGRAQPADARVVAAYFNARVLAVSIRVINALRAGEPVGDHASGVQQLIGSAPVARWLQSSTHAGEVADLQKELRSVTKAYVGGPPLSTLEEELTRRKRELSEEGPRLEFFRRASIEEYNARVDGYNRRVRAAKATMREYRRRLSGVARLEVAFNRCLDAKILFARFGRVEITRTSTGFEDAEEADSP